MKITYLGTAASEGWPAEFCECDICRAAMKRGGRDLRLRSCALIDDDLLTAAQQENGTYDFSRSFAAASYSSYARMTPETLAPSGVCPL